MAVTELLWLLLALFLPWLAGVFVARFLLPTDSSRLTCWGVGFFLGYAFVAMLLWLEDIIFDEISFFLPALVLAGLAIMAWSGCRSKLAATGIVLPARLLDPTTLVVVLFAGILVVPVFADVWHRPMFPWDAWDSSALRAKVFAHHSQIMEFVSHYEWKRGVPNDVFSTNIRHPVFIPLVQTWMALGLGRWSDSLVNLPWPLAWISLSLAVGGAVRDSGRARAVALLAGLAVLTTPIMGIHAVLAGYLDLWLTAYCAVLVIAASLLMHNPRSTKAYLLALVAAVSACATKEYGILLVALLAASYLLASPPRRTHRILLPCLIGLSVFGLAYLALGAPFDLYIDLGALGYLGVSDAVVHIPGLRELRLESHGAGAWTIVKLALTSRSIGLLFWVCLGLSLYALRKFPATRPVRAFAYWIVLIVTTSWITFTYTHWSRYIELGTLTERYLMIVLIITLLLALLATGKLSQGTLGSIGERRPRE